MIILVLKASVEYSRTFSSEAPHTSHNVAAAAAADIMITFFLHVVVVAPFVAVSDSKQKKVCCNIDHRPLWQARAEDEAGSRLVQWENFQSGVILQSDRPTEMDGHRYERSDWSITRNRPRKTILRVDGNKKLRGRDRKRYGVGFGISIGIN